MERFELTAQQVQILNTQLINSGVNNTVCYSWNMGNSVNYDMLKSALDILVANHKAFCVRIVEQDGRYYQECQDEACVTLDEINLTEDEYDAWVKKFVETNIEIDDELYRFVIVNVDGEYRFFIKIHHIIADARSMNIIADDVRNLYLGKKCRGDGALDYAGYVAKSHRYINGKVYERDKEYWQEQIDTDNISLLSDERNYYRPTRLEKVCDKALVEGLNALCEENKLNMVAVLYFAFALNLSALTFSDNFYLGTALSMRNADEENTAVGMFSNIVPLKIELNRDRSAVFNIKRINSAFLNAFKHGRFNCSDYLNVLGESIGYKGAFFDVFMNYYKFDSDAFKDGCVFYSCPTDRSSFCVDVIDNGNDLRFNYNYSTKVFDDQGIELFNERFINILEKLVNGSVKKPLNKFRIMTEFEESVVRTFNGKEIVYPKNRTLVGLFESQVKKTPESVAVARGKQKLTYSELNTKSNQLARKLRKLNIQPDDLVVVVTKNRVDMTVGMYGVLKSGAAYVPVNANCPTDMMKFILGDCKPKCILVSGCKLPVETDVLTIDIRDESIYSGADTNLKKVNSPDDLACVLYKIGITDMPVGVMIEHKNFVSLLFNSDNTENFDNEDIWSNFNACGGEFPFWDIYGVNVTGSLTVGKRLGNVNNAISNMSVYILNGTLLCGINMIGELCIAGDSAVRGYLNAPELTAEKFVENPFGNGKLYRSGCCARWLPDGKLEYLGKADKKFKENSLREKPSRVDVAEAEAVEVQEVPENLQVSALVVSESIVHIIIDDAESDTNEELNNAKTLIDFFEEQVKEKPDDLAVNFENESLTFSELNEKSNQIARKLRKMGVHPNDYVMIFAKPSIETVIASYAVLKSGGAYVPVDSECSKEKIKYILKDSNPKCILTFGLKFPVKTSVPVVEISDRDVRSGAFTNLKKVNKSSDCAYVIYDKLGADKANGIKFDHNRVLEIAACDDRRMFLNTLSEKDGNIYSENLVTVDGENGVIIDLKDKKSKNVSAKTMAVLFEEQVKRNPDGVAVAFKKEKFTYSELNAKSNQLARKLRKLGIKPGDFVMIMANQSIEKAIAVYAVLKSGGAYVSIDGSCSKDKFKYVLKDINPKCILAFGMKIQAKTSIPVIELSDKATYTGAFTNPEKVNKPSDCAYVNYLADTTGELRKMIVQHASVADFISYNSKKIFQPLL